MKKVSLVVLTLLCAAQMWAQTGSNAINGVTMRGKPVTLLGTRTYVGETAPSFSAIDRAMKEVSLSDFKGKTVVLSVFPSVDTKVCAAQTRQFNKEASDLGDDVVVLTISKDLPFALDRFCAAEGIDRIFTLSDYRENEFGTKYGFLMKENMLLARGVVVIDKQGKVAYVQYVKEIGTEPDYNAAMAAIKEAQ